jgi:uncharacterized protein (DUF697 family)
MNRTAKDEAEKTLQKHVLWSMGTGLIPFPIVDTIAVTAVQIDMLRQLSHLYGKEFSENIGKSVISLLTGGLLVRQGASLIKAIPILGSFVGGVSFAILSGASTYAIGTIFIEHFEKGGDWLNFDSSKFRDYYKEKFEQGKDIADQMRRKAQQPNSTSEEATAEPTADENPTAAPNPEEVRLAKLQELHDLHQKGILSDEEYQRLKEKVLGKF